MALWASFLSGGTTSAEWRRRSDNGRGVRAGGGAGRDGLAAAPSALRGSLRALPESPVQGLGWRRPTGVLHRRGSCSGGSARVGSAAARAHTSGSGWLRRWARPPDGSLVDVDRRLRPKGFGPHGEYGLVHHSHLDRTRHPAGHRIESPAHRQRICSAPTRRPRNRSPRGRGHPHS
jgi:hypothetical protein